MEYRILGRSGLKVSAIGMGCEGFVDKPYDEVARFVDIMEEKGINCLDLYTPDPQLRTSLGKAIKGRRDKFILQAHLCTIWKDEQYKRTRDIAEVKEGFADLLRLMEVDKVEIGMLHYVDSVSDWEEILNGEIMAFARELKEKGVIENIGLSSHNPVAAMEAVKSGLIDVLMFSVNPCYDLMPADEDCYVLFDSKNYEGHTLNMDPDREALYELCQREGVGITVMKAFGGGDLLSSELSPAGAALSAYQCIGYALDRPAVASILCGAKTEEELLNCAAYYDADASDRDYAAALSALPKVSWQGHCMYCGHCAPCVQGIDVASVTKFLNLAKAQGMVPETVREHYAALVHHAGDCIGCGECETRCPFGVSVTENMAQAKEIFGY